MKYKIYFLALAVLILDQLTKYLVRLKLPIGNSINIFKGFFYLSHVRNKGILFGLFPGNILIFQIATIIIIILIIIYNSVVKSRSVLVNISFTLIIGGATGNFIDRYFLGGVVDFLDFRIWPVFNVADMAIVGGVILFLIYLAKNNVVGEGL